MRTYASRRTTTEPTGSCLIPALAGSELLEPVR